MTTKDSVLAALHASDDYVSGEALAASCGISRTSVWKAIKALEALGYQIDAVSNKGYRLRALPDVLSEPAIQEKLSSLGVQDTPVHVFSEIDSTLAEAKRLCADVGAFRTESGSLTESGSWVHRTIIVADKQTAGRGRLGRTFVSPAHSGVYFTLVYAPVGGVTNPALLTAAAAVAVSDAVDALYGTQSRIKWVNDVFLGGKKICGILTEGVANFETGRIEAANVGIGINVRDMHFPPELASIAGSIQDALSSCGGEQDAAFARVSRNELVALVCKNLLSFYDEWEKSATQASVVGESISRMVQAYRAKSMLIGKEVLVHPAAGLPGEPYQARVLDIADDASLVVQCSDGSQKALQSGEVSLHSAEFST